MRGFYRPAASKTRWCAGHEIPMHRLHNFGMPVGFDGSEPQVNGHVIQNLHLGNDRAQAIDVLIWLLLFIGNPLTFSALRVIDEVTPRRRACYGRVL
jgi:hypothetical protein